MNFKEILAIVNCTKFGAIDRIMEHGTIQINLPFLFLSMWKQEEEALLELF